MIGINYLKVSDKWLDRALSEGLLDYIEKEHEHVKSVNDLTSQAFCEEFFMPQIPVLIKGGCSRWPAYTQFSIEYLKSKTKNVEVQLNRYSSGDINCLLHTFFDNIEHKTTKHYLQELNLFTVDAGFSKDILNNDFCIQNNKLFELFGKNFHSLWIGVNTAVTGLHQDFGSTSTLHAQIRGIKKWVLIYPQVFLSKEYHDTNNFHEFLSSNYSYIKYIQVEDGDILFIPAQYYHYVSGAANLNVGISTQLLHPDHLNVFIKTLTYSLCNALTNSANMDALNLATLKTRAETIRQMLRASF